jgi:hypothetical protein
MFRFLALLLLGLALAGAPPARAQALPEVWLATVEPGEIYWQRFGHNAILLIDPVDGSGISYNFGYFSFEQENFLLRFAQGKMLYQAVAIDAAADLDGYLADGRRVWLQRLRLPPERVRALAAELARGVRPENRDYRYDYYLANCSTRVRDALDAALGGALERATGHRSQGQTFRRHTRAHTQKLPWLYLATDLALGQPVDAPITLWQQMFLPAELMRAMAELRIDGEPVVMETRVLPAQADPELVPPEVPDFRPHFAAAGLLLAGLLMALARLAERAGTARLPLALVGSTLTLAIGCAGVLLAFLWLATDHAAAARNENLFLFAPVWLLAVPAWGQYLLRGKASPATARLAHIAAWIALASLLLGAFAKVFRTFDQSNIEWLLLMWPPVLALRHLAAQFPVPVGRNP